MASIMLEAGKHIATWDGKAAYFSSADFGAIVVNCGLGAVDANCARQPVQDAAAPPLATPKTVYRVIPRAVPLKQPKCRRRTGSGGGSDEEGGWDGVDDGSGGFGGPGNWGRGGWDGWGDSWNDEWGRWHRNGDALNFLYQVTCWISLTSCLHHAMKKSTGAQSVEEVPNETGSPAFAQCSAAFRSPRGFEMAPGLHGLPQPC